MTWTEDQLAIISAEREDLRILPYNVDIIVMEFLRLYDVNVQPTDVGIWNGWDTLAALDTVLNLTRGTNSIASSLLFSSRSMQLTQGSKQGAEDWTTWKKWALDHEKFEEFRTTRVKEIKDYNNSILEKINNVDSKELNEVIAKYNQRESDRKAWKITGLCLGLARKKGGKVWQWRLLFIILSIPLGFGIPFGIYLIWGLSSPLATKYRRLNKKRIF